MNMNKTKKLAYISLLIALQVVLGRFAGIMTPVVSINFSFIPLIINAILFGPFYAAASSAVADVISAFLFPQGLGIYFPGYTLSAALNGLIYGLILYRKPKRLWRISFACIMQGILISLGLSTYWVYMMTGKSYLAVLPTRILQNAIMIPVKIFVIWIVVYRLVSYLQKNDATKTSQCKSLQSDTPIDKTL